MTETKHKNNRTWSDEEKSSHNEEYGCEIIIENGTISECNTRNAPTDALIVHYVHNDRDCYDLTRGSRTKLFDMYYDCLLYTSDAADDSLRVDLGGRRII